MGGGPAGTRQSGKGWRVFPLWTRAPGSLLGSWAWSSTLGSPFKATWVLGAWGGGEEERQMERALQEWRIGGNTPSISPTHLGPREPAGSGPSLVLCPLRPEALLGPSGYTEPKPRPRCPRDFSGCMGLKPRPQPQPKPHSCLSLSPPPPRPFLACFFSTFCYCGSVLPSGCCSSIFLFF